MLAVSGPRDEATKFLSGKPLERATVATVEYTTGGLPAVTLELRSRKLDLAVEPEAGADISALRAKVLQRFLQECQIEDSERRVVWSRVKMQRKPGRETDA
jgi:hypothetical protein